MTNPTLERAARAACVESFGEDVWSFVSESTRQAFRKQARAVLMAVREPDEAMLTAIQSRPLSEKAKAATNSFDRINASTEALWQAGIDAILNDGEGE